MSMADAKKGAPAIAPPTALVKENGLTLLVPARFARASDEAFALTVLLCAAAAGVPLCCVVETTAPFVEGNWAALVGTTRRLPLLVASDPSPAGEASSTTYSLYATTSGAAARICPGAPSLAAIDCTARLAAMLGQAAEVRPLAAIAEAVAGAEGDERTRLQAFALLHAHLRHDICLKEGGAAVLAPVRAIYHRHLAAIKVRPGEPHPLGLISDPLRAIAGGDGEESAARRVIAEGVEFVYDWSVRRVPRARTAEGEPCKNVLITAALPYVNNVPHLGNIIGAVLSGDVFARYCRLRGYETLYVCGTDEYGTATETKALEEGISCGELCEKYFKLHGAIYDWFGISTDIFGRSSTPKQTAITHEIFAALYGNGYFFEEAVEQTFCEACARFLADRYVEGTCPHCKYVDARGDQCDACGKLLNTTELIAPRCKVCRTAPVLRWSNHLFLDLTKLQPLCQAFVDKQALAGKWSANSTAISKAWLTEGLRPRCMTRDLRWGTPVPIAGFEDKVFYVWFDACFGYISITANYTDEWRAWWQCNQRETDGSVRPPVELYQFMGKDNVPFHTVIFPSTLLGTSTAAGEDSSVEARGAGVGGVQGEAEEATSAQAGRGQEGSIEAIEQCPWTLLHHISTTEYLNYESGKFSKSRAIGVFGNDARDSGIPVAMWRYYLLSMRPEVTDSAFSWDDFAARINNELLANLGNFVSRVTKFASARYGQAVPAFEEARLSDAERALDAAFVGSVNGELGAYLEAFEAVHIKGALRHAMAISALGNQYLSDAGLDGRLFRDAPDRCASIIAMALNFAYLLSALFDPFIPTAAEDVRVMLNAPTRRIPTAFDGRRSLGAGHSLGVPFHLFAPIAAERIGELRSKFAGAQVL